MLALGIYIGGVVGFSVLSIMGDKETRTAGLVLAWLWPVALPAVLITKMLGKDDL